ncbi:MAG: hemerythrin family protein [Anaerolineales bacterium]|nr:hemerythrin family protein [Anaerolineales bacterium]MCB9145710.1 hemerythrin family protein [Anaerolineales bacterium]
MYTPKILEWDEALSTGDSSVDEQHKYLVETLNSLGTAILDGHGTEAIARILGRMRFYAGWHFDREEECFEKYQCPAAEMNKNAHAAFVEKFDRYHKRFHDAGGSNDMALKIHQEITDWIVNHIMRVDGELYPCIHHRPKP